MSSCVLLGLLPNHLGMCYVCSSLLFFVRGILGIGSPNIILKNRDDDEYIVVIHVGGHVLG